MRILVTGGTGFIGQHLVPALAEAGHEVALVIRGDRPAGLALPEPLRLLRRELQPTYADLRNFALTSRAIKEAAPDAVVHLAARGATDPFLPPDQALRHNVSGTLNLLRACFETGRHASRLVVARTPGEIRPHNVYAASKAAAWGFCRMYATTAGWPIAGAMIFQAYGPGQASHTLVPAAVQAAMAGEDLPLTRGRQRRDWIHVADVAEAIVQVATGEWEPGSSFDIGTGIGTSVLDVVELIYRLADRGGRPLPGHLPERPDEPPDQVAATEATAARLGWQARTLLEDGLAALVSGKVG